MHSDATVKKILENFVVVKLELDSSEAKRMGVKKIPALYFFSANNAKSETLRYETFAPADKLAELLQKAMQAK